MSMKYLLGIDGGGSKTLAVVVDDTGKTIGVGKAGGGNHQISGVESAAKEVERAAMAALGEAGLTSDDIAMTIYGLAGADRPHDFEVLTPHLANLPFSPWTLVCDTMTGLRTGSPKHVGVVIVCGSGTNAVGRNARGETLQIGGFGRLYGDSVGGYALSVETFRRAVRSYEGREVSSRLTETVPEHLGYPDMAALLADYLDKGVRQVPMTLTEVLHETAAEGDLLSARLLSAAGRELGLAAATILTRLGGFGVDPVPVVLTGSILQKGKHPALLQALYNRVREDHSNVDFVTPQFPPVYGAVMLAMDALNMEVTFDHRNRFRTDGGKLG